MWMSVMPTQALFSGVQISAELYSYGRMKKMHAPVMYDFTSDDESHIVWVDEEEKIRTIP